jgi:hypothetical protein
LERSGGLEINEISSWEKFQSLVEILKDIVFILETAFKEMENLRKA